MKICKLVYFKYNKKILIKIVKKLNYTLILRFLGPLGILNYRLNLKKNYLSFKRSNKIIFFKISNWELDRIIFIRIIRGLVRGYKKILYVFGMGYKIKLHNNNLILTLGFSHLILFKIPYNINIKIIKKTHIVLKSTNNQLLNQTIFLLKNLRKFSAYKEKGIRLNIDNYIFKEGKKRE